MHNPKIIDFKAVVGSTRRNLPISLPPPHRCMLLKKAVEGIAVVDFSWEETSLSKTPWIILVKRSWVPQISLSLTAVIAF